MTGWIGITLGDVTGIGPEVTLKALAAEPPGPGEHYVLVGDIGHVRRLNDRLKLNLQLGDYSGPDSADPIALHNPSPASLPLRLKPGAASAANAAMDYLRDAARRCLRGELDAVVTAPVNKEAIIRAGHSFTGQTELFSQLAGTDRTVMMLLGADDRGRWLRVALATTHVSIRNLPQALSPEKVELAIELAAGACRALGLATARVAACGLNPHAGEGGALGTEEQDFIGPVVAKARKQGFDVVGPLSADALFYYAYRGDYDAVVAMYHDQGLAPLKMVCFENGVNWTLGLPFIRTSPDHGTAYDIAGQGKANPSSMLAAMRLARQLVRSRGVGNGLLD
jgi:4-hydroxythreonine-4-phosphate dehydrogenase